MTEKTLERIEDALIWTLIGIFGFLIVFLASYVVKVVFFDSNENKIHTETMYVGEHQYTIFYDADNEVQHIEHSPDCDCLTIEYD